MGSRIPALPLIPRMDRTYTHFNIKSWTNQANQHPSKFWETKMDVFNKNTQTKMTALARSIDSNGRLTISYWKINKNRGIGKKSVFHHASLFLSLLLMNNCHGVTTSLCSSTLHVVIMKSPKTKTPKAKGSADSEIRMHDGKPMFSQSLYFYWFSNKKWSGKVLNR